MFDNRVLRRIFGSNGSKRDEVYGSGEDYLTRGSMIDVHHQILKSK